MMANRVAGSASSRFLMCFVILLISVFQVISGFKIMSTYPHRHESGFDAILNHKVKRLTLFERFFRHHRNFKKHDHSHHEKLQTYHSRSQIEQRLSTSCGELLCYDVKEYPEELIRQLFVDTFKRKLQKIRTAKKNSLARMINSDDTSKDEEILYESNLLPISGLYSSEHSTGINTLWLDDSDFHYRHHERPNCDDQVKIIYPKEAINLERKSTFLVNLPGMYSQKALGCAAKKYCKDDRTPENHINYCKSKTVWKKVPTFNKLTKSIEEQTVQITNGCDCQLIREKSLYH